MKPCPHCGVMLTASLVDAIKNPSSEESCPKAPIAKPKAAERQPSVPLATLMMLAHAFQEASR